LTLDLFFLTLDHFFLTLPLFFDLGSLFFDLGSLFLDLDLLFLNLGMFLFNLGLLSHTCLEPCAILHFFSVCVMLECVVPQLAHVLGIRIYSKIRLSYIAFPLEASALTWHVARNMALLQGRHGFAT